MAKHKPHSYQADILKFAREGRLKPVPGVHILHVYHEDGCEIFKDGACNCSPDYVLETPNAEKYRHTNKET